MLRAGEGSETPPRVSVITVVRNGERYLAGALQSIVAQTLPAWEVLVIDGQSEDGTVALARSFPGVRCLAQPDRGLAQARNLGLNAARGDWVAFLDHDDWWPPQKLAVQTAFMQHRDLPYTTAWLRFVVEEGAPPRPGFDPRVPRPGATPGTLLARRELFAAVGGFDPAYTLGCDADWFTRARDRGVPTAVVPEVLLYKRLHEGNLSVQAALNRREMFRIARQSLQRRREP